MTRKALRQIQTTLNSNKEVKYLPIDQLEILTDLFNKDLEDLLNYETVQVSVMIDNVIKSVQNDTDLEHTLNYNRTIRNTMRTIN